MEGVRATCSGSRGTSLIGSIRFAVGITKGALGLTSLAVFLGFKNPSLTSSIECAEGPALSMSPKRPVSYYLVLLFASGQALGFFTLFVVTSIKTFIIHRHISELSQLI